jgi:hypothetical protein
VDNVSKARQEALEAARGKKATERSVSLKKHYKKILQVSFANGSCEAMDESMDKLETTQEKWIKDRLTSSEESTDDSKKKEVASSNEALNELKLSILQFAERSGMQLTGKRDANADQPDTRSMIELALCEEVIETAEDFFNGIDERMEEMNVKDGRMKSTIHQLRQLLEELYDRNLNTMETLGQERPPRSRKLKSREAITKDIKKELAKEEKKQESTPEPPGPPAGMPGRGGQGGLMAAVQGRGRGGAGGGLMDAIAGRGRGRGGGGGLMDAIAGRGRGGGGGPGGLLAAIAARKGGS